MKSNCQIQRRIKSPRRHTHLNFFKRSSTWSNPLSIESSDIHEQEADSIANKIMQSPESGNRSSFFQPKPIPATPIQRKESATPNTTAITPAVNQTLNSSGQPLDDQTRSFMEQRFGYGFGNVRVHNNSLAHKSAADINAQAYTNRSNIVFGAGMYSPGTTAGKQLLAHELTHVVQQSQEHVIQRKPATATPVTTSGVNIIVSLDGDNETKIQSKTKIKGAKEIRAYSLKDLVAKLSAHVGNIDNLIVYSHGSGIGQVKFVDKSGNEKWVSIADMTKALTGKINFQINNIEFEGCSLGNAGADLKSLGTAMNAKGLKAHSCFTFVRIMTGISINNYNVKKKSDIKKGDEALFEKTLLDQVKKKLVASNGTSVTDCVEGITPLMPLNTSEVEAVFFANNGVIIAEWDSPKYNQDWQPGSLCKRDVTATTTPCKLIEVTP